MDPKLFTKFSGTRNKSAAAWETMAPDQLSKLDNSDLAKAERTARLIELFKTIVWQKDVLPILSYLYDETLIAVKEKEVDPDALVVLDKLLDLMHYHTTLGYGAMERITQRRMSQANVTTVPLQLPPIT